MTNLQNLPNYFNRHQPGDNREQLLFRATNYAQASEFNELQSIARRRHQALADVLFRDGALLEDGEIDINRTDNRIRLSPGRVYVQGKVFSLELKENIELKPAEDQSIGVWIATSIITEENDQTLLGGREINTGTMENPINDLEGYNLPGAAREVTTAEWGDANVKPAEASTFAPVYQIIKGQLLRNVRPPEIRGIAQTLATRDYEVNGSYLVKGFRVSTVRLQPADNPLQQNVTLQVATGVGRPHGFRLERQVPWILETTPENIATQVELELQRLKMQYMEIGSGQLSVTFQNTPVVKVSRVTVNIRTEAINELFTGDVHAVNFPTGVSAASVRGVAEIGIPGVQGGTIRYDNLPTLSGSTINWSSVPNELKPNLNQLYHIAFWESNAFDEDAITFSQTSSSDNSNYNLRVFNDTLFFEGRFITNNENRNAYVGNLQNVDIDYSYILPTWSYVIANSEGDMEMLHGTSSVDSITFPIEKLKPEQLLLAEVFWTWQYNELPTIRQVAEGAVSQPELVAMQDAITELTLEVKRNSIANQLAMEETRPQDGVLLEPFLDYSIVSPDSFNIAILDGELLMAVITQDVRLVPPDNAPRVWTLPRGGDEVLLQQEIITESILINEFAAFDPIPPLVRLTPSVDVWVDERENTIVQNQRRVIGGTAVQRIRALRARLGRQRTRGATFTHGFSESLTVATQLANERTQPAQFIRAQQVRMDVEAFQPGEVLQSVRISNIDITPDGVIRADASGRMQNVVLDFPGDRIPAGEAIVEIAGTFSRGESVFVGQGTISVREWVETRTVVVQRQTFLVFRQRVRVDPVAQTFLLPEARQVSAIDINLTAIGDVTKPIRIQLRTTAEGTPTSTILGEAILSGARLRTGWQRAIFELPIYIPALEEHAIVVLTDDNRHAVGIATLGQLHSNGSRLVTSQPYTVGVLLQSSNASTWTPRQSSDLAFRIHGAVYTSDRHEQRIGNDIDFNPTINNPAITDIHPAIPVFLPESTSQVRFRVDATFPWFNNDVTTLLQTPLGAPNVRQATLVPEVELRGSRTLSPVVFQGGTLALGTIGGSSWREDASEICSYIAIQELSRLAQNQPFEIIARMEFFVPAGLISPQEVLISMRSSSRPDINADNLDRVGITGNVDHLIPADRWTAVTVRVALSTPATIPLVDAMRAEIQLRATGPERPRVRALRLIRVLT